MAKKNERASHFSPEAKRGTVSASAETIAANGGSASRLTEDKRDNASASGASLPAKTAQLPPATDVSGSAEPKTLSDDLKEALSDEICECGHERTHHNEEGMCIGASLSCDCCSCDCRKFKPKSQPKMKR